MPRRRRAPPSSNLAMHAIRDVPGKGKGLVATRRIAKGTRILSEQPLIQIPPLADMAELCHDEEKREIVRDFIDGRFPADRRKAFFALHNAFPNGADAKYVGRLRTNGFRLSTLRNGPFHHDLDGEGDSSDEEEEHGEPIAVFRNASRINHDCESNAHNMWNEITERYTVHALRDIDAGEEITVNYTCYTACFCTRHQRQTVLREQYAFDCSCRLCSLPLEESLAHDAKVELMLNNHLRLVQDVMRVSYPAAANDPWAESFQAGIDRYTNASPEKLQTPSPDRVRLLQNLEQAHLLYTEEGLDSALPGTHTMAGELCLALGDLARCQVFYQRAERGWSALEGDDSPAAGTSRDRWRDPPLDGATCASGGWETVLEDVPVDLDADAFEAWLWRRDTPNKAGEQSKGPKASKEPQKPTKVNEPNKPKETPGKKNTEYVQLAPPQKLADFRSFRQFPTVGALPNEDDVDLRYYRDMGGYGYEPKRHWCFLGEIVEVAPLGRVSLEVKDRLGNNILVSCYTESKGFELDPHMVKEGHTVAILYAHEHEFMFSPAGIRHEDPSNLKIFPVPIDGLMTLSDRVKEFVTLSKGMHKCHGCGKRGDDLKRCSRCSMFEYCNGACQKRGWTENGHKADCKLLCDPDLTRMFTMDWDWLHKPIGFPLADPSNQPASPRKGVVLILSMTHGSLMQDVCADLLDKLRDKADVKIATTPGVAKTLMDRHRDLAGILIADECMATRLKKNRKEVAQRVVQYARGGGTVVVGGLFSQFVSPSNLNQYFEETWSLPWKYGSYHRTTVHLNESAAARHGPGLPASYSQKAVHIQGVDRGSAWYLPGEGSTVESHVLARDPIADRTETPVAFEKVGEGWLGYTGDINSEDGTTKVVLGMLQLL